MIKQCVICGRDFNAWHPGQRYCSPECSKKAQLKQMREWRKQHKDYWKELNSPYPCNRSKYRYSIPPEVCLNCNIKKCRYDND